MRITAIDRIGVKKDLLDTRADSRLCYACIPILIEENFDVDTSSANDMTEGNGLGRVAGTWRIYALRVHYRNVDSMLMTFGHVPSGVELGDALINFNPRDLPAFQQMLEADESYLEIDGDTFHLISILPSGLGGIEEWAGDARSFQPKFRAPGH